MRTLPWMPLLAALLMALGTGSTANAGYCGAGGFNRCPSAACAPCGASCQSQVSRPVYNTCYRDVCCKTWQTQTQTCYRDVCYTVKRPVTETKMVQVCTGEWKTETTHIPGPVTTRCVRDCGTWELDPCTGCCC